ncbi:MAG: S1C family serine protease [Treponema sp.]|nr:S1C family serine protease [Treponema sp.]
MKKTLFAKLSFFAIFTGALALAFTSCSSLTKAEDVFVTPDYTEKDILENEKRQIEKIAEEHPVEALWRARLSGDQETMVNYEKALLEKLDKAYSGGNFLDAWRYYLSLEEASSELLKEYLEKKNISQTLLYRDFLKEVPSFNLSKEDLALLPKTIDDCVNATVTIWVDKGIKIENGIGYADRVLGSGFFIDTRGYIVTNNHVISDLVDPKYESYTRLYIKLAKDQETRIPAKVIGYDQTLDLALLKAEITPPFILRLGSSSDLKTGDKVSAIGTPLGLYGTVTTGIVSAVGRKLFTTGSVLQIDAAVNSGNSGGPCIDSEMKVQAVVFAGILQYQGLNFAIPVEYLKQDLPFLYAGGKRRQVWTGSFGHTFKNGSKENGLEVQYVMPGESAFRSGLKKGDIITGLFGRKVNNLEDFQDILRSFTDETLLKVTFDREGKEKEALLYLSERPEHPGYEFYKSDIIQNSFIPIFGMELTPSSTVSSRKFTISDIIKGSVADESGFSVTDPVTVTEVDFTDKKEAIYASLSTRKKKKGYLDISIRIANQTDSPYYF